MPADQIGKLSVAVPKDMYCQKKLEPCGQTILTVCSIYFCHIYITNLFDAYLVTVHVHLAASNSKDAVRLSGFSTTKLD